LGTAQPTFFVDIDSNQNTNKFIEAFESAHNHYKILQTRILHQNSGYIFKKDVSFNKIPILFFETTEDKDWKIHIENEINTPLDQQEHLWRALILTQKNNDNVKLIITFHHSIIDGLSGKIFVEKLLYFLNNKEQKQIPIPPPIENVFLPSTDKKEYDTPKKPHIFEYQNKRIPFAHRTSRIIYNQLSSEDVLRFTRRSRKHGLTTNSIFNAAMLLSAYKIEQQEDSILMEMQTPVSLINRTDKAISNTDIGFFCSFANTFHEIDTTKNILSVAKEYQEQLKQKIRELHLSPINSDITEYISKQSHLWDQNRDYFCNPFMVTNLGNLKFSTNDNIKVKDFRFFTGRKAGDNNMMLLISSINNSMNLSFGYTWPLIEENWAQSFSEFFMKTIRKIINE
jgi:hypothetical protein